MKHLGFFKSILFLFSVVWSSCETVTVLAYLIALQPPGIVDFNGDGKEDLVVGVPYEDVTHAGASVAAAGAVHVIYGGANGLTATDDQLFHQGNLQQGVPEYGDHFGAAWAAGDFDADGYGDLAIGVPGEDVGDTSDAGMVQVIYGGPYGLAGDEIWHQDSQHGMFFAVQGKAEAGDGFGSSLVTGNFNGDHYVDLAIGVPGEDIGSIQNAGAVNVLYGGPTGLTAAGSELWHQATAPARGVIPGTAQAGDRFGFALAAGDFDDDGNDDLAIGVPHERVGSYNDAGAVNVLYGTSAGLSAVGSELWHQDTPGIGGWAEAWDRFGRSLAVGDFDGDDNDDLAVGIPYEDVGSIDSAGAVQIIYGSGNGLSTEDQLFHQDVPGIGGYAENNDKFGSALATGDFDGDGEDDLAVGIPYEDVGSAVDAGAVQIIYGSQNGLSTVSQLFHQETSGFPEHAADSDKLGSSLVTGDFDYSVNDSKDDLAIGVPHEDVGQVNGAGAVHVLYGGTWGLSTVGNQLWHQDSPGIEEVAEPGDRFGS